MKYTAARVICSSSISIAHEGRGGKNNSSIRFFFLFLFLCARYPCFRYEFREESNSREGFAIYQLYVDSLYVGKLERALRALLEKLFQESFE